MRVDILIKNGKIIDGTGAPAFAADLAIAGGDILDIGRLDTIEAAKVINADGKTVTPGFIDIHSHNDVYMNREGLSRLFEPFVRQGITTCVTGNCGLGIAPFTEQNKRLFLDTVASLGVSMDEPFEWSSMDEYLSYVDRKGPVLNMAHIAPHGPLRIIAMGERNTFAAPDDVEFMKSLLTRCMEAGCFGFSTGLMYYPGLYSHTDELIELNSVCGKFSGRYSTHLRAQCTTFPHAVREAVEIARKGGTGLQISHFHSKPFLGGKAALLYHLVGIIEAINGIVPLPALPNAAFKEGLAIVDKAMEEGLDAGMDMVTFILSNTTLSAVFPPWSHFGGMQELLKRLADPSTWAEIKKDMQTVRPQWPPWGERSWSDNYSLALGWHTIRILSVNSEKNRRLEGMHILDIARERHIDPWEAARQISLEENGMVTMTAGYPSKPWIEKFSSTFFTHPQVSPMCDAVLPENGKPPQTAYGTFPRFLGRFVRELKLLSLPEAIRKITSLPAARYGIKERGELKIGYRADIVVMDECTVQDRSTLERPDTFPRGIDAVIINGKVVLDGDTYDGYANAGRVLRKQTGTPSV